MKCSPLRSTTISFACGRFGPTQELVDLFGAGDVELPVEGDDERPVGEGEPRGEHALLGDLAADVVAKSWTSQRGSSWVTCSDRHERRPHVRSAAWSALLHRGPVPSPRRAGSLRVSAVAHKAAPRLSDDNTDVADLQSPLPFLHRHALSQITVAEVE